MSAITAVRRQRARPLSPDERRAAIVAVTTPLLLQHGAGVTTRQVALAAGIAEGTIFRVFPDKQALFHAVAHHVIDPPGGRELMADYLTSLPSLREKVVVTVERMVARSEQAMTVMMALRSMCQSEGPPTRDGAGPGSTPGPSGFITDAQEQLLANLVDLVFEPHADELRIPARVAAVALRSLVLGSRHPGRGSGARDLTATEIADVLLVGVTGPACEKGRERC